VSLDFTILELKEVKDNKTQ